MEKAFSISSDSPFLSLTTTCKGRLHHLKETFAISLPEIQWLLGQGVRVEVVLLDYNSPDGMKEWVLNDPDCRDLFEKGFLDYVRTEEPEFFHMSHSKNVAKLASTGLHVCNLDADNYLVPGFLPRLEWLLHRNSNAFVKFHGSVHTSCKGRIAMSRENFVLAEGYDEVMRGWGAEDQDLGERIRSTGCPLECIPKRMQGFLLHGDDQRTRSYSQENKNKNRTNKFNNQKRTENAAKGLFAPNDKIWGRAELWSWRRGHIKTGRTPSRHPRFVRRHTKSVLCFATVKNQSEALNVINQFNSQSIFNKDLLLFCPKDQQVHDLVCSFSQPSITLYWTQGETEEEITRFAASNHSHDFVIKIEAENVMNEMLLEHLVAVSDNKAVVFLSRVIVLFNDYAGFSEKGVWSKSFLVNRQKLAEITQSRNFTIEQAGTALVLSEKHEQVDCPEMLILKDKGVKLFHNDKFSFKPLTGRSLDFVRSEMEFFHPGLQILDGRVEPRIEVVEVNKIGNEVFLEENKNATNLTMLCRESLKTHLKSSFFKEVRGMSPITPNQIVQFMSSPEVSEYSKSQLNRLWRVYSGGGVSIESDVLFFQGIDFLKKQDAFFALCNHNKNVSPCIFGSKPNNPIIKAILDRLIQMITDSRSELLMWQEESSILGELFSQSRHGDTSSLFLPESCFCLFRVPSIAQSFAVSDQKGRDRLMDGVLKRVSGDFPVIGLYLQEKKFSPTIPIKPVVEASIADMGRSLGRALLNAGKDLVQGRSILVTDDIIAHRESICAGKNGHTKCEFFIEESERCSKCGCKMRYKNKLRSSSCPIGKW